MKKTFRRVWPYIWRYRRNLGLGMGALVIKDLVQAVQPLVLGWGIDTLTRQFQLQQVVWFAVALIGISAFKGIFQYWMRVILIGMSRDVEFDMRNDLFNHLVGLSSDFYSRYRTGDLMARATNDLNAVRMMLGPGVMYWTETMLTFVLAIAVMASVDWQLTLASLLPAPLVSFAVVRFGGMIHRRFEEIQKMFSDISSRVQENLAGVRVIRAYVQEE
ncbi:MAG TPA: ABC transporter transmembrane domain-containing protein, partial [Bryobacteraceae bacterium]|nr:ABC transporter transmembrane domain-containing protein [Bryobacteraceae bacterium]